MVDGGWVLDFTRLMRISTQVEVVVEVGVELGKNKNSGYYRVTSKTVYILFSAIPQLPVVLRRKVWTFFNNPVYINGK